MPGTDPSFVTLGSSATTRRETQRDHLRLCSMSFRLGSLRRSKRHAIERLGKVKVLSSSSFPSTTRTSSLLKTIGTLNQKKKRVLEDEDKGDESGGEDEDMLSWLRMNSLISWTRRCVILTNTGKRALDFDSSDSYSWWVMARPTPLPLSCLRETKTVKNPRTYNQTSSHKPRKQAIKTSSEHESDEESKAERYDHEENGRPSGFIRG
jgi:hypothetical protein